MTGKLLIMIGVIIVSFVLSYWLFTAKNKRANRKNARQAEKIERQTFRDKNGKEKN